jgi:hypothetical protein
MNQQQALAFVQAINAAQPYVPPMIFSAIVNSDVARILTSIANNQATCDVKPVQPTETSVTGG